MDPVTMEVESCEPDSTAEVIEDEPPTTVQPSTAMQILKQRLIENQNSCANMVAASMRERDRVRAQLRNARRTREAVMADLRLVLKLRETTAHSCMNAKASLQEAKAKRAALLKQLEIEKMWRPASVVMSLKKQRELRERVEYMRALLRVKIRTPDDIQ